MFHCQNTENVLQNEKLCFKQWSLPLFARMSVSTLTDSWATQKQATHTRVLEVKPEVYGDTDRKRTNSYRFYSCLQTTIERKKSYWGEADEMKAPKTEFCKMALFKVLQMTIKIITSYRGGKRKRGIEGGTFPHLMLFFWSCEIH